MGLCRGTTPPHYMMFWIVCILVFCSVCFLIEGCEDQETILPALWPQPSSTGPLQREGLSECWLKERGAQSAPEIDRPRSPLAEPCWFCHFEQREIAVNWAWGGLWICVLLLALGKIAVCTWSLDLRSKFNNGYVYALSFLVLRIPFDVERVSSLL